MVAARILADVGDVARFADRNRFASWTGTAPLDASSGEQNRHRLSRAGNRRMNHMIHIAAITQLRLDTEGRAYYRRKRAEGKKPLEAMRCLKRRISDAIYRQLVADAQQPRSRRGRGPGRALRGVSRIQRGRPAPAHRHFGSATSRTRTDDATRRHDPCEPPPGLGSPATAPTRRSRQGGAPHRTNDLDGDKRRRTLKGAESGPLTTEGSRNDATCIGGPGCSGTGTDDVRSIFDVLGGVAGVAVARPWRRGLWCQEGRSVRTSLGGLRTKCGLPARVKSSQSRGLGQKSRSESVGPPGLEPGTDGLKARGGARQRVHEQRAVRTVSERGPP